MQDQFQREVLDRLIVLETLLKQQDYKGLSERADAAYNLSKQNEKEIADLKEKNRWFARAITGAVITALIGLLFVYLKIGLGVN